MLKKHFSKIVLLTTTGRESRAERALGKMRDHLLIESDSDVQVVKGILGSELPAPAWWRAGNGAWGCLQSHIRIVQDAWLEGLEDILILEDDILWVPETNAALDTIMPSLPKTWGQLYLGGQHTQRPEILSDNWLAARSVNRTHAYALNRRVMPQFLQHVSHAPDYIHSPWIKHIDHQLETAHQRGDWNVLAPRYWLAGQDENYSGINGRHHMPQWWDWCETGGDKHLPFVVLPKGFEYNPVDIPIHEGYDEIAVRNARDSLHSVAVYKAMVKIWHEAWGLRRLPAIRAASPDVSSIRDKCWGPGFLHMDKIKPEQFRELLAPERFKFTEPDSEEKQEESLAMSSDERQK